MNQIFVPATQDGLQIAEFPLKQILDLLSGPTTHIFEVEGKSYKVDFAAVRYQLVKASQVCACCGLRINRCFLELNKQLTEETGVDCYSIGFYAEAGDLSGRRHLNMMTRDHIVPNCKGGEHSLENSQLLCVNCNHVKGGTEWSLEEIRRITFPAYRIYKSTFVLNATKERLEPFRAIIKKNRKAVDAITKALEVVNDNRIIDMKDRRDRCSIEAERLQKECDRIELEAQVTGVMPELECLKHPG